MQIKKHRKSRQTPLINNWSEFQIKRCKPLLTMERSSVKCTNNVGGGVRTRYPLSPLYIYLCVLGIWASVFARLKSDGKVKTQTRRHNNVDGWLVGGWMNGGIHGQVKLSSFMPLNFFFSLSLGLPQFVVCWLQWEKHACTHVLTGPHPVSTDTSIIFIYPHDQPCINRYVKYIYPASRP